MRTLLLTISLVFFYCLPAAYSQHYYPQASTPPAKSSHILTGAGLPRLTTNGQADYSYFSLNYYLADSALYGPAHFMGLQGQLINESYVFPKDTSGSYKAKSKFAMNYDCINSIAVAFNALPGGDIDTIAGLTVDTVYVPIIQVNHSGLHDTLQIALTTVDVNGYPDTSTYITDTLVIDSNNANNIGAGNDYTINTIKWKPSRIVPNHFAIIVRYSDPSKHDSCWFIYGYGYFTRTCPYEPHGDSIFASPSHFATITTNTKSFTANSFALWYGYRGLGYLPSVEGDNVFAPCTASDTDSYHPGTDGANYLQDIDIGANIFSLSYLGVQSIHSMGLNVNQNYPNPFNNSTVISYSLSTSADVSLKITDIAGREVLSQNYGTVGTGQHSILLNASTFSQGVYFYSIISSGYTVTKKMVIY